MYLSWDNGNMTTYEALKWLTEEFPHTQYIDPFAVDNYYIDPEVTWKDIAIKSFMEIGPRRKELIEQHIEKYKQKKLKTLFFLKRKQLKTKSRHFVKVKIQF